MLMDVEGILRSHELTVAMGAPSAELTLDAAFDAIVEINVDGVTALLALAFKQRAPYPNELNRALTGGSRPAAPMVPTLVAPYFSEATGEQITNADWSWIDTAGNMDIRAPGLRLKVRAANKPVTATRRYLPSGAASTAIIRTLIETGSVNGVSALAQCLDTSQPRVSQVLGQLTELDLLERISRSVWRANTEALLDAFLASYSGPGGSTSWYYSLDPAPTIAQRVLDQVPAHVKVVVSGDVAADQLSPWRTPTSTTIYVDRPVDLSTLNLVAAQGRSDANVTVTIPNDRSVFISGDGFDSLAHPTQVLWDLHHLGADDRLEHAQRLRAWLISR